MRIWGECEGRVGHLRKRCTYSRMTTLASPPAACNSPCHIRCTCTRCTESEKAGGELWTLDASLSKFDPRVVQLRGSCPHGKSQPGTSRCRTYCTGAEGEGGGDWGGSRGHGGRRGRRDSCKGASEGGFRGLRHTPAPTRTSPHGTYNGPDGRKAHRYGVEAGVRFSRRGEGITVSHGTHSPFVVLSTESSP